MGSPEGEAQREAGEIQHPVTLTEELWLADTVCIQAMWEAITGTNPNQFKGDDLPVERVSWNHVINFVERLNVRVPDLSARLPTEAEW